MYSFYKGVLPFNTVSLKGIKNTTYNVELKEILEKNIYELFPTYGNINIHNEDTLHTLLINIVNYSKTPENYDNSGNIINYKYILKVQYTLNDTTIIIINNKTLNSDIVEKNAEDSIIVESLKNFIDKLRSDF